MRRYSRGQVEIGAVSPYSLITFDVFDTLLTRPLFRPADLFLLCADQMSRTGVMVIEPERWRDIRCAAEQRLQSRSHGVTYNIFEIHTEIAEILNDDRFDPVVTSKIELDVEAALSKAIAETNKILRNLPSDMGTAIISDTYFSTDDLRSILQACGVAYQRAEIVSSCSAASTKERGGLFSFARTVKDGKYDQHLHIGDNVWSDVYRAAAEGCNALHYADGKHNYVEKYIYERLPGKEIVRSALAGSMRSARLQLNADNDHERGVIEVATSLVGPLLTAYVSWIIQEAQKSQIKKLFFFSREGEVLLKIARLLIDFYEVDIEIQYLHVSRQSLHLPALDGLSADDISSMNIRHPISAARIFTKLEIELDEPFRVALLQGGYSGPTGDEELSDRDLKDLIGALRSDTILSVIVRQASRRRQALIAYLKAKSFFGDENIGLVDIGWKGRLQRSLCVVARDVDPEISSKVTGFYYSLFDRPANSGRLCAYADVDIYKGINPYVRAALFEVFCAAQHGTTLYYHIDAAGHVKPVLASDDNPDANRWGVGLQQQGAEVFLKDFLSVNQFAQIGLENLGRDMHRAAELVSRVIVGYPAKIHADTIGSFPHAADEPDDGSFEIAPPIPLSPRKWFRRFQRRKYRPLISNWPEGSIVRALPWPLGLFAIVNLRSVSKIRYRIKSRRRR